MAFGEDSELRWPRTKHGWKTFFWLTLGCCPVHHRRMSIDNPLYDDRRSAFCFKCEGIGVWPQGPREALRQNAKAYAAALAHPAA